MSPTELLAAPDGTRVTITRGSERQVYTLLADTFPGQRGYGRRAMVSDHPWSTTAGATRCEFDYGPAHVNARPDLYEPGYLGQVSRGCDWYRSVTAIEAAS